MVNAGLGTRFGLVCVRMWMMNTRGRRLLLTAVLVVVTVGCDATGSGPPVTESESGNVVGQQIDVDAFRVDVAEDGDAVFVMSGTVPSPCHEAVFGFEEPDGNGVMVGTAESWFDPTCTAGEETTAFSVSMELTNLDPGNYVARLEGGFEAGFSIPQSPSDGSDLQGSSGSARMGAPVVMADWAAYPFEGIVTSSDVVVVGTVESVDPVTKWSTPDGALEPTYSSGDMPGGLPEEWQEVTVAVDQVIVDTRGFVSTAPLVVRYPVTEPGYEPISVSQQGARILVSAFFSRVPYTDGSIVEQLTLDPQGTYLETTTGDMAQLFSVADGSYYSVRAAGITSGCSQADVVALDELVARATDPDSDETEWLGYGDEAFSCPESNTEIDLGDSTMPRIDTAQSYELQLRAFMRQCEAVSCGDGPVYASSLIPAAVQAELEARYADITFVSDDELADDVYGEGTEVPNGGVFIWVGGVEPTELTDVFGVDVWHERMKGSGLGETMLFQWSGSDWIDTTPEATGIPDKIVIP